MPPKSKRPEVRRHKLARLLVAARARKGHNRLLCSGLLGVSPTTVANWEDRGKCPIKAQRPSIAQYLALPLTEVNRICPSRNRP